MKEVIMYEYGIALLVQMQIELASHLKRQRCENGEKTLTVEQYIKELISTFNYPQNKQKCQNTGHVSQTE